MNKERLFSILQARQKNNEEYYQSRLQRMVVLTAEQAALIERLEILEAEPILTDSTIIFEFSSNLEASTFTGKLLGLLPEIEKFQKEMTHLWSDKPRWVWKGQVREITIEVIPASKPEDCTLRQTVTPLTSWSCEKNE